MVARRSCPFFLFLVRARELIRFPNGPRTLFSSAWYLSGAEIDDEGDPEAEVFAVPIPSSIVELRPIPSWFLDRALECRPEVIRTRDRKWTLGMEFRAPTMGV